jgi:histone acetyltransferase 1
VFLSPSCQSCDVQLLIDTCSEGNNENEASKKRKIIEDDGKPTKKVCFDLPQTSDAPCRNETSNGLSSSRTIKMQPNEILERLGKALPTMDGHIVIDGKESLKQKSSPCDQVHDQYLAAPIGTKIREYKRGDDIFLLCVAEPSESACSYHNQIQKLGLWFIETADGVDLKNTDGGTWKVLYLFHQHELNCQSEKREARYSLAGYITLFSFYSPFRKPQPGLVMRICQALILPRYQRAGHGRKMLHTIYDLAHQIFDTKEKGQEPIREINVEDPAPAFTALRNSVDFQLLFRHGLDQSDFVDGGKGLFSDTNKFSAVPETYLCEERFENINERDLQEIALTSKLTRGQIQIAHEIFKLGKRDTRLSQIKSISIEEEERKERMENVQKQYRLMVKRRLNQTHKEDLGACESKEDKKAKLEELFVEALQQYQTILGKTIKP